MTRSIQLLMIAVLAVILLGCRSAQQNTKEETRRDQPKLVEVGPGVQPNHCRLVGTVVAIDAQLSGNADDPCSKAPCIASVKIEEIIGYGSGFVGTIGKGKEIRIRFRYTVAPSNELFPQLQPSLPGLVVGSKFQADVRMTGAPPLAGETPSTYFVEQYDRK